MTNYGFSLDFFFCILLLLIKKQNQTNGENLLIQRSKWRTYDHFAEPSAPDGKLPPCPVPLGTYWLGKHPAMWESGNPVRPERNGVCCDAESLVP